MDIQQIVNLVIWGFIFIILIFKFIRSIRIVPNRFAFIVERFGKYHRTLEPGFHALLPFIDHVAYIQDLKEKTIVVPPQECFTNDNVKVEVDGVIYISVVHPKNASYGIADYRYAAMQLAQTTTRSVIGTLELDRTFEERDVINTSVMNVLQKVSEIWGIRLHRFEVKNIVPPKSVNDAMEKQMSAEREKRAIIAQAEGVKQGKINRSEGLMREMVNKSEGEKQRKINEATGKAKEIETLAFATAASIEKIADAITVFNGEKAVQLRLIQDYLSQYGNLAKPGTQVLLPKDLSDLNALLQSVAISDKEVL